MDYSETFAALAQHYNSIGVATFAIDWGTAHGMIPQYRPPSLNLPPMSAVLNDAYSAARFLSKLPFIDRRGIFFEGFSLAGRLALSVAAEDRASTFAGAIGYTTDCAGYAPGQKFVVPALIVLTDTYGGAGPCAALRGPNVDVLTINAAYEDIWKDRVSSAFVESQRRADALIKRAMTRAASGGAARY
ncbi:MAG TPA: hypothetical protein VJ770_14620 [Stellaceae bacterium]|nr:hypothetical protein [Stellaceae bacterium]